MLGNWPCFDPQNFSQHKPNFPSNHTEKMTPITITFRPTHDRSLPPPHQVIGQEAKNILLRHLYQHAEQKLRPKRGACDTPTPERASKLPRVSTADHNS